MIGGLFRHKSFLFLLIFLLHIVLLMIDFVGILLHLLLNNFIFSELILRLNNFIPNTQNKMEKKNYLIELCILLKNVGKLTCKGYTCNQCKYVL